MRLSFSDYAGTRRLRTQQVMSSPLIVTISKVPVVRRPAGLVLSGRGDDGAEGLGELRRRGGFTAAQGPASSVVYGMPRAALESGSAEHVLEIEEIPDALRQLASAEARGPQARRSADHGHFRDGDDEWR